MKITGKLRSEERRLLERCIPHLKTYLADSSPVVDLAVRGEAGSLSLSRLDSKLRELDRRAFEFIGRSSSVLWLPNAAAAYTAGTMGGAASLEPVAAGRRDGETVLWRKSGGEEEAGEVEFRYTCSV